MLSSLRAFSMTCYRDVNEAPSRSWPWVSSYLRDTRASCGRGTTQQIAQTLPKRIPTQTHRVHSEPPEAR